METVFQGEDKEITITLTSDGETPLDLNGVAGITCQLLDELEKLIQKYNTPARAEYKPIILSDPVNGQFTIKFQSADTKKTKLGKVFLEIKIEIADVAYDENTIHNVALIHIINIVESNTVNETDLTP